MKERKKKRGVGGGNPKIMTLFIIIIICSSPFQVVSTFLPITTSPDPYKAPFNWKPILLRWTIGFFGTNIYRYFLYINNRIFSKIYPSIYIHIFFLKKNLSFLLLFFPEIFQEESPSRVSISPNERSHWNFLHTSEQWKVNCDTDESNKVPFFFCLLTFGETIFFFTKKLSLFSHFSILGVQLFSCGNEIQCKRCWWRWSSGQFCGNGAIVITKRYVKY